MRVLAIDPGPTKSAWVVYDDYHGDVLEHGHRENEYVLELMHAVSGGLWATGSVPAVGLVVIEKVESFGMPVGAEVFETVYWSGRFAEAAQPVSVKRIGRKAVKLSLCGSARAKDGNVRQALIDRYGGKDAAIGRKATPGPLHGIAGDVWSALAVAVAWSDREREKAA